MKKFVALIILVQAFSFFNRTNAFPDEGMWIPALLEKYNIGIMKEKGFRLSAEDVYSVNRACMKDAVLSFGGGCTGAVISPDGLLITNHHCGYGQIQRLSTVEQDYLANGFWAMSRDEELQCPGLFVTFLKSMEDVTEEMLTGVSPDMNNEARDMLLNSNSEKIRRNAIEGTHFTASVSPFFMGNQYFLLVYETFNDVRLVGAPPSSIGKFGGETDNWTWPRHTGDFALFRIYAGRNNEPSAYSPDNVPFESRYHFPVSLRGVNEGDFTMIFGYPGSTMQYVPSYHIDMIKNYINPEMILIREKKIEVMEAAMNTSPKIRLQYSAKKSGIANGWKKWIGENQGLEKMQTISRKEEYEKQLTDWINADEGRREKYGHILPRYAEIYPDLKKYSLVNSITNDAFFSSGIEAAGLAANLSAFAGMYESSMDPERREAYRNAMLAYTGDFFRNYDPATDRELFVTIMQLYGEILEPEWQAPEYIRLKKLCKGDFRSLADRMYGKTIFADEDGLKSFIRNFRGSGSNKLKKDPFYKLAESASGLITGRVRDELSRLNSEIRELNRLYMALQMEYNKDQVLYPDANSTLRIAYGTVSGYRSADAVYYSHLSILKGVMEKYNPEIFDYNIPDRLIQLYEEGDFGRYSQNGQLPVCFIASNHTTGGNSGSPVINSDGHLAGVNFDRAWEGVASDMAFNPEQSRNISIDIRFALFIIDKFAGAAYLLDEMTIVE